MKVTILLILLWLMALQGDLTPKNVQLTTTNRFDYTVVTWEQPAGADYICFSIIRPLSRDFQQCTADVTPGPRSEAFPRGAPPFDASSFIRKGDRIVVSSYVGLFPVAEAASPEGGAVWLQAFPIMVGPDISSPSTSSTP